MFVLKINLGVDQQRKLFHEVNSTVIIAMNAKASFVFPHSFLSLHTVQRKSRDKIFRLNISAGNNIYLNKRIVQTFANLHH